MSLLDDLKKKAEELQVKEQKLSALATQNIIDVDKKLKKIFVYLDELAKTISVIKPKVEKAFTLGIYGKFDGLVQSDHFADYRLRNIANSDHYELISFHFKSSSSQELASAFDDVLAAERFEKFLWEHNILFKRNDVLNQERRISSVHFRVPYEVRSELTIHGQHADGEIRITSKNIGHFGQDDFVFSIDKIDDAWFDELTKFLMMDSSNRLRQLDRRRETISYKSAPKQDIPQYEIHRTPDEAQESPKDETLVDTVKGLWKIWKK